MFWTSSIQNYKGKHGFDITYKTNSIFSPTKELVYAYKYKGMSQEEYTKRYYDLMRRSYINNKEQWQEVLDEPYNVFLCYCKANSFCHRYLLKDILIKLGKDYQGEL